MTLLTRGGVAVALLLAAVAFLGARVKGGAGGRAQERCVAGTYLVEEGSGTTSLWTFGEDGSVIATSSAQALLRFSDLQGSWEASRRGEVNVVTLDMSFDAEGALVNFARVDMVARLDRRCETIEGEFSLRFFESGEDPLDPASDTGEALLDTFVGRRVSVR